MTSRALGIAEALQAVVSPGFPPEAERELIFAGLAHAVLAIEQEAQKMPLSFEEKVELWAASERLNSIMHGGRNG